MGGVDVLKIGRSNKPTTPATPASSLLAGVFFSADVPQT